MASTDTTLTLGDVLHRLVENSPAFGPAERTQAHEAITGGHGGDRHYLVPDPDDPDAGRQDAEPTEVDSRDQEIARLRAELERRDAERAEPEPGPDPEPDSDTDDPAQSAGNGKHSAK